MNTATLPRAIADVVARGELADAMQAQIRRVGGCERPIRLVGRASLADAATGEVRRTWSSENLPDGTVLVACGNRRASRCGPCSRLYQGDAFQLVVAGLRGGKHVPDTVASHPTLFVTLTAPSFGPVHTTRLGRDGRPDRCRRRAHTATCEHGRPVGCPTRHEPGDPLLGQPLCTGCFDYEAAVLWNAHASELWRRTRIGIDRRLAALAGVTVKRLRTLVRVQYVKVAEFQRRGLIHFHLAVRLDAADVQVDEHGNEAHAYKPPPPAFTADLLAAAIEQAAASARAPCPSSRASAFVEEPLAEARAQSRQTGRGSQAESRVGTGEQTHPEAEGEAEDRRRERSPHRSSLHNTQSNAGDGPYRFPVLRLHARPALAEARWGSQLHITPILADDTARQVTGLERGQVAGYLGKYATKHTEALGGLDRRVDLEDVPMLLVNPHIGRLVATALLLTHHYPAPDQGRDLKLDRWAHQLGYGGHWLTKSRAWSTTFTALRAARRDWQQARNPDALVLNDGEVQVASWQLAGIGYRTNGDAWLAELARRRHAEARQAEREQRADRQLAEALAA